MRTLLALLALAAALSSAGTAAAHHPWCDDPCHQDAHDVFLLGLYVVTENDGTVYVYQESNGVEGLQRCDPHHMDANCECPPDTLLVGVDPPP